LPTLSQLEFYARYVWPVQRVVAKVSRRCSRCILSEKCSPLEGGVCEQCRNAESMPRTQMSEAPETLVGLDEFVREVESFVGTGRSRHDALLLLSGGKDSAFVLHKMRTTFPKLRLLCLTVDNGFMSPVALTNAAYTASKMESDLLTLRSRAPEFARALREAFLSVKGRGCYSVVDYADGSLVFQVGRETAEELGIPLLIGGLSWVQLQHIVGINGFEVPGEGQTRSFFPLAVWRVNEQVIRKTVTDLGLIEPGQESPLATNSPLITAMTVVDVLNLGYSSFEPEFAQLVREGKTDRRLWLHLFEMVEYLTRTGPLKKEAGQVLAKLDLTLDDVVGGRS
jgi:hypothetical protein